jgi:hypothetical protein
MSWLFLGVHGMEDGLNYPTHMIPPRYEVALTSRAFLIHCHGICLVGRRELGLGIVDVTTWAKRRDVYFDKVVCHNHTV